MPNFNDILKTTSESNAAAQEGCVDLLETLDAQAQDLLNTIAEHPFAQNAAAYAEALPTSPAAAEMAQSSTFITNAKTVIEGAQRRAKAALAAHAERTQPAAEPEADPQTEEPTNDSSEE